MFTSTLYDWHRSPSQAVAAVNFPILAVVAIQQLRIDAGQLCYDQILPKTAGIKCIGNRKLMAGVDCAGYFHQSPSDFD